MKRMLSVLLCAAILGGLTGCSGRENPESLRGESSAAISEVTEQIPSNGETSQETLSLQEPPLSEADWETPLPDFLDETQQELYLRAKKIFPVFSTETNNIDLVFDGKPDWESIEIDGEPYLISNGRYAQWENFMAMMKSLFAEEYIAQLTGADSDTPTFLEYNGRLCYREMARGSRPGYQKPDTYELSSKTEEEITFNLIGHYIPLGGGEVYTESYPIRMVYTEKGWRFAEFNIAQ